MARFLRELHRNQPSSTRFISTFTQQKPTNLPGLSSGIFADPVFPSGSGLSQPELDHFSLLNASKKQGFKENAQLSMWKMYPSFSSVFFANPILLSGSGLSQPEMDHFSVLNPSNKQGCTEYAQLTVWKMYPSFSSGFFVDPKMPSGSVLSQMIEPEVEQRGMMWADSVKRKRKRKINKHKLKKRMKLLRRKTRKC